jgi:hypothetical protein
MHDIPPPSFEPARSTGTSPYLEWALATRFSYLRDGDWIPVLIEFDPVAARVSSEDDKLTALQAFAQRRWLSDEPRTLDEVFVVPALFESPPVVLRATPDFNFCIGLIRRDIDAVKRLTSMARWKRTIRRLELGPPIFMPLKPAPRLPAPGPAEDRPSTHAPLRAHRRPGFLTRLFETLRGWFGGAAQPGTPPAPPPPPGSSGSSSGPRRPQSPGSAPPPQATLPPSTATAVAAPGDCSGTTSPIDRVVIAVIDQGIAFANQRFIHGGEPCIEYLWQQNVLGKIVPAPSLTMPFTPGFELDKAAIKQALVDARNAGGDEDWIYRKVGGLNFSKEGYKPLARRRTHGTHVMDLAGGGLDPAAHPLIAVDMPEDAVGDPAGSTLAVQAAWGLIYAMDRAERLRKPNEVLPVVANISYGPHEGPHDGSAVFERFMDALCLAADNSCTPLEIVLAAGNFRQTRVHAELGPSAGKQERFAWRLQPESLSPSLMEIWLPKGGQPVTVTLTPPFASATRPPISVSPGTPSNAWPSSTTNPVYWATYVPATVVGGMDSVVLGIARTAPDPAGTWGSAVAPSGAWQVDLQCNGSLKGVKAWIKRSDTLSGRRAKGRQSYFYDAAYPRFAANGRPLDFDPPSSSSYVRRFDTLSGIATGGETRVIAGFTGPSIYPARYSSHGMRNLGGTPTGPDWSEFSEECTALHGVLAAGTRSGSAVAMNGTSVAAPQATRWLAQAWRGLTKGSRPPKVRPGLKPPRVPPERPIPAADLAAIGSRLAARIPRSPPRC